MNLKLNNMLLKLKHYFLILLSLSIFLVGCSGGDDDTTSENQVNPNDNSLKSLSFTKADNSGLTMNCAAVQNDNLFYVTLPDEIDLTKAVPSFIIAEEATASVNGKSLVSGQTAVDFSNTTKITVTSKSGLTRTYTVLAKNGNTRIDNMVYSFMVKHKAPAVSLALSKDESLVYKAAYGFADVAKEERVTSDYMFRLASMSKQHTAIAIMKLYEEGKLDLEDRVFGKDAILGEMLGDEIRDSRVEQILRQIA